ncbi:MAG: isoaspartyl peptidase/L-asparaginase [Planctomycetes bacterium]|nr:isoaspartyl peptidase/L-asparaginase [Planctomycetota bacterium]
MVVLRAGLAAVLFEVLQLAGTAFVAAQPAQRLEYAIVLHGGALDDPETMDRELRRQYEAGLGRALEIGKQVLATGGSSLDAVEQVIRSLEDDPTFNAGKGAVYNSEGGHELDASIMDGSNRACGAVAGVRTVKNPISLARLVMTRTRHVLLVADGAEKFAGEMEVPRVEPSYFDTDRQHKNWLEVRERQAKQGKKGTVGCVALDKRGNIAAGTSTGGLTNKKYGRVGDSPIVGAGTYADNATCGVSCTGTGEEFIRNAVAHDVSARMRFLKLPVAAAARQVVHEVLKPDDGALIALSSTGEIAAEFNTGGLARAAANSAGLLEVKLGK